MIGPVNEICNDDLDNNCDGYTDEGCPDGSPQQAAITGRLGCSTTPVDRGNLAILAWAIFLLVRIRLSKTVWR